MAGRCDPTDELITYLEMRLEADGLDYREAVMIEDLMASLSKLQGSDIEEPVDRGSAESEPILNRPEILGPKRPDPERF